jgi:hypothetical protein
VNNPVDDSSLIEYLAEDKTEFIRIRKSSTSKLFTKVTKKGGSYYIGIPRCILKLVEADAPETILRMEVEGRVLCFYNDSLSKIELRGDDSDEEESE